ncbi:MAG: alkaline phosphatase [Erythrobacter sp.]|nr:MAG: alkaline phosphatase [Erythrobacter sp.]
MKHPFMKLALPLLFLVPGPLAAQQATDTETYRQQGEAELEARRAAASRPDRARNVIIFIGDGMGVSTITAARILAGQQAGVDGESYITAMDELEHTAMVRTYSHDGQVSDSAPTATAILAGVKTRNSVIGLGPEAVVDDCASGMAHRVPSLLGMAQEAGLATGIVTTTSITHATPAAGYAHTPQRDWESDARMPAEALEQGCVDIARQLVEGPVGSRLQVILGGGRSAFMSATVADPEYADRSGDRRDGRDLVAQWQAANPRGTFAWNAAQLSGFDVAGSESLLGLFEPGHMQYEADRSADPAGEPSLADMVELAVRRLSNGPQGYVLLIEGGRIDHAHHAGNAYRALSDAVAMDEAVARVMGMVDLNDTLVVTTADHSHTLTMSGYPQRGNSIMGTVAFGEPILARDGMAYTTLAYANGPGSQVGQTRSDPAHEDTGAIDYRQQALIPLSSETHGGEDVVVRASGPGARLFSGTLEQHTIFYIMRDALFGSREARASN